MMLNRVFGSRETGPADAMPSETREPSSELKHGVALALGGGAARGWAHIGVIRALEDSGIRISMIAGTSIGALVGGCYLSGKLDELEDFARSLTRRGLIRYLDLRFGGAGLIGGMRLSRRLTNAIQDVRIEDLDRRMVCVATEARSGHEVWLDRGSLVLAMRASYALPGVFEPVLCSGRRLLDGALVNPVPVSVCRAYEETLVIAVNLNYDLYGRAGIVRMSASERAPEEAGRTEEIGPRDLMASSGQERREALGVVRSMVDGFNIIQDRISRSRLAGDPPDLSLNPPVRDIGLSEFHRAAEAIDFGYQATLARIDEISRLASVMQRA